MITQKRLLELFTAQAPKWAKLIDQKFLPNSGIPGQYWPDDQTIFRALAERNPTDIRYIIVGQDPYFEARDAKGKLPIATGIAFDIHDDCEGLPPSLRNIVRHIAPGIDAGTKRARDVFRGWVKDHQILMLNAALTVERGEPGTHLALWRDFVGAVIQVAREQNPKVKVIAWGAKARDLVCAAMAPEIECTVAGHPQGRGGPEAFDAFWSTRVGQELRRAKR